MSNFLVNQLKYNELIVLVKLVSMYAYLHRETAPVVNCMGEFGEFGNLFLPFFITGAVCLLFSYHISKMQKDTFKSLIQTS